MEDPEVIVGQIYQQSFGGPTRWLFSNVETKNPRRIPMSEACAEMAKYWNCTPEDARESLLKHGYASSPNRDWRVVDRGYNEQEKW